MWPEHQKPFSQEGNYTEILKKNGWLGWPDNYSHISTFWPVRKTWPFLQKNILFIIKVFFNHGKNGRAHIHTHKQSCWVASFYYLGNSLLKKIESVFFCWEQRALNLEAALNIVGVESFNRFDAFRVDHDDDPPLIDQCVKLRISSN